MKRRLLYLIPVAILALALWKWLPTRATTPTVDAAAEIPTVSVVRAVRQDIAQSITVTAELTPFEEVEVMAKVSGYVQQIFVDAGDVVRRGQTLAILEVPEMQDDLTRSAAAIERNRAEIARCRDEIKRAESAASMTNLTFTRLAGVAKSKPGLVAQQEIDDAQSRDLIANAQLAAARSALSVAEEQLKVTQAEQGKFTTLINYSKVIAPFDGVVTHRYANTGSMIQAGTASQSQAMPLVRISRNQLLRIVLPVPEAASGRIRVGMPARVFIPSLQRTVTAKVSRASDKVDTSTRTMETEIDLLNSDRTLIPGMFAEVRLDLATSSNAVVLPLQALDRSGADVTVHVVDQSGSVLTRKVSLGIETATLSEIKSGVEDGDTVVVGNLARLVPNQKVKPRLQKASPKGDS